MVIDIYKTLIPSLYSSFSNFPPGAPRAIYLFPAQISPQASAATQLRSPETVSVVVLWRKDSSKIQLSTNSAVHSMKNTSFSQSRFSVVTSRILGIYLPFSWCCISVLDGDDMSDFMPITTLLQSG